jgi:hypothetical protein
LTAGIESGHGVLSSSAPRFTSSGSFSEAQLKLDTAVKLLSSKIDEVVADLQQVKRSQAQPSTGGIGHLSVDDLNDIISRAVNSQVSALTSRLRADVDKAVGTALQSIQVSGVPC